MNHLIIWGWLSNYPPSDIFRRSLKVVWLPKTNGGQPALLAGLTVWLGCLSKSTAMLPVLVVGLSGHVCVGIGRCV